MDAELREVAHQRKALIHDAKVDPSHRNHRAIVMFNEKLEDINYILQGGRCPEYGPRYAELIITLTDLGLG